MIKNWLISKLFFVEIMIFLVGCTMFTRKFLKLEKYQVFNNNSGAEDPAAINVAPATSSDKSNFSEIASREGTKKSSQMIAIATNNHKMQKA